MEVIIGSNSYSATPSEYPAQDLNKLAEIDIKLGDSFRNMVVACNFDRKCDISDDTPRIVVASRVYDLTLMCGVIRAESGEIVADLKPLRDAKINEINSAVIRRVKIRDQDYVTVPRKDPNKRYEKAVHKSNTLWIRLVVIIMIELAMILSAKEVAVREGVVSMNIWGSYFVLSVILHLCSTLIITIARSES